MPALVDILASIRRCPEPIQALMHQTKDCTHRVSLVTDTLRSLWPNSPVYACLLLDADHRHASAKDEVGQQRLDWAGDFQQEWSKLTAEERFAPDLCLPLPSTLNKPDFVLAAAASD